MKSALKKCEGPQSTLERQNSFPYFQETPKVAQWLNYKVTPQDVDSFSLGSCWKNNKDLGIMNKISSFHVGSLL